MTKPTPSSFDRFRDMAQKVVTTPKADADKERETERKKKAAKQGLKENKKRPR